MSVTEKEQAKLIIQEHKVELINEDILETLTESEDVNELIDQTMVENFDSFKASLLESQEAMMALTKQQLKVKDEVIQNQKKMREIEAKKQEEELRAVKAALAEMNAMWQSHYEKLNNHEMVGPMCV